MSHPGRYRPLHWQTRQPRPRFCVKVEALTVWVGGQPRTETTRTPAPPGVCGRPENTLPSPVNISNDQGCRKCSQSSFAVNSQRKQAVLPHGACPRGREGTCLGSDPAAPPRDMPALPRGRNCITTAAAYVGNIRALGACDGRLPIPQRSQRVHGATLVQKVQTAVPLSRVP